MGFHMDRCSRCGRKLIRTDGEPCDYCGAFANNAPALSEGVKGAALVIGCILFVIGTIVFVLLN